MSAPNTVPVTPGTPLPEPAGLRPARIGPYPILRVLGQGGMGLVYKAEAGSGGGVPAAR